MSAPEAPLLPTPEFLRRQVEATDRCLAHGEWTEHATVHDALRAIARRRGILEDQTDASAVLSALHYLRGGR